MGLISDINISVSIEYKMLLTRFLLRYFTLSPMKPNTYGFNLLIDNIL